MAIVAANPLGMALAASGVATLDSSALRTYDVPAGPLGKALSLFAAQTGIALSFDPALTEGNLSLALSGQYTARAAAAALTTGTGLELIRRPHGT